MLQPSVPECPRKHKCSFLFIPIFYQFGSSALNLNVSHFYTARRAIVLVPGPKCLESKAGAWQCQDNDSWYEHHHNYSKKRCIAVQVVLWGLLLPVSCKACGSSLSLVYLGNFACFLHVGSLWFPSTSRNMPVSNLVSLNCM